MILLFLLITKSRIYGWNLEDLLIVALFVAGTTSTLFFHFLAQWAGLTRGDCSGRGSLVLLAFTSTYYAALGLIGLAVTSPSSHSAVNPMIRAWASGNLIISIVCIITLFIIFLIRPRAPDHLVHLAKALK
jgi:hypothetical protein